ncbi:hypothetical protein EJB05_56725, partial [Eragrostis curvula]
LLIPQPRNASTRLGHARLARLAINTRAPHHTAARQAKPTRILPFLPRPRNRREKKAQTSLPSAAVHEIFPMSSMMTMASSSLNPNAPIFIPAAYRQVEDYSPEWWELVKTTAWFRDHWVSQHQLLEAQYDSAAMPEADALDLLDTDDLFYSPDNHHHQPQEADVLRSLTLNPPATITSPRGALWDHHYQQPRHADKPAQQHVGLKAGARRVIHQPR